MTPVNIAVVRSRTRLKGIFAAHAAAIRCSKLNRTDAYHPLVFVPIGERRCISALSLESAARHRRAAVRALRHYRLTLLWASQQETS